MKTPSYPRVPGQRLTKVAWWLGYVMTEVCVCVCFNKGVAVCGVFVFLSYSAVCIFNKARLCVEVLCSSPRRTCVYFRQGCGCVWSVCVYLLVENMFVFSRYSLLCAESRTYSRVGLVRFK